MKTLSKDARGFIEGIAAYIRSDVRAKAVVPKVQSLVTKVTAQARKEEHAHVKSAVSLLPVEKKRIEAIVAGLLGHTVEFHYSIDTSLVGGIQVRVADWVVDSSLTTQVTNIARLIASV